MGVDAVDIEPKRLDSLARNRASAELKKRHPEEWEKLREEIHKELLVERYVLGKVVRTRAVTKHLDDGEGTCEECGRPVPCEQMKKRERERAARQRQPVQTTE